MTALYTEEAAKILVNNYKTVRKIPETHLIKPPVQTFSSS